MRVQQVTAYEKEDARTSTQLTVASGAFFNAEVVHFEDEVIRDDLDQPLKYL